MLCSYVLFSSKGNENIKNIDISPSTHLKGGCPTPENIVDASCYLSQITLQQTRGYFQDSSSRAEDMALWVRTLTSLA